MTALHDVRSRKSTTVRLFTAPLPIRAAFRVLDRVAPWLGARWAERIWFTLPPSRPPSASLDVSLSGFSAPSGGPGAGSGTARRFTVDVGGHRVAGQTWGTGPAVYLMHGWAGYAGQLAAFVEPLVDRGYRVVAFDAPSHGRSGPGSFGPRSSSIPEFAAALTAVVDASGPAHAVIAHSLGGTATAVALCDGLAADRVALLAPMASPVTYAGQLGGALGFGERTHRRLLARVERRVGAPMRHFDVPELGRAVAMPPTLVVHDRDDVSTPVADGAAIAAAWPSARLRVTTGLGHRRMLRDADVVTEVVDFITS